jgi:tetracycline repressor-like protein
MSTEPVRISFRRHVREQVLRATPELTIEKGWEQVRMSEVAESVGVSRPTLYKSSATNRGSVTRWWCQRVSAFWKAFMPSLPNMSATCRAASPQR